jgi:hypothetical protein
MFQMFDIDVAKVDRDVAYVVVAANVGCKRCSQCLFFFSDVGASMFIWMLRMFHICCNCFIWMLRIFAMIFKCFKEFLQVFQTYVVSVLAVSDACCICFIWMLKK